jgi:anti-sigma regulatory factor (Ser/Thr protein kinase)
VERAATTGRGLCLLGEVGFATDDRSLDEWRRYEALASYALSPFPLRMMCGYNTLDLPGEALVTAELTHPFLRRDGRQAANPAQVDPAELMRLVDADDALVPEVEADLTIEEVLHFGELHRNLQTLLLGEGINRERVDDLVLAVHEVATNGVRHGEPPVTIRVWLGSGRVVCTVTDRGAGFDDPFVGYVRGAGDALPEGRFGLWLARELSHEVVTSRTPEGFTVRLVVKY